MKHMKRILALIGALLLFGMYIATLIFALIDSPAAFTLFKASVLLTIAVPCLLYAMILIYRFLDHRK